jgi:hypothetical protein
MINCGPQTFWRPVCSTYPEVCELLPNQWMHTTAALKIWCIPAKTRNPPKNLPCIYGLVSRSARTNRQTSTNKQINRQHVKIGVATPQRIRLGSIKAQTEGKKKLFQEQTGSRTKPWRGYYSYDSCAGWECCDWIRWQRNTRQSIVDALHDGTPRRTPRRQSIVDALDERPSRRTPWSSETPQPSSKTPVLENTAG